MCGNYMRKYGMHCHRILTYLCDNDFFVFFMDMYVNAGLNGAV